MSLTTDSTGAVVVLDQTNGRLVRVERDGRRTMVPLPVQVAQDVAIAKDGTAAVLDRLVDRAVALVGPDGKPRGELKIEGRGISEGGAVTGVFTRGNDIYVEREHGDLVKLGSTSGAADPERPELPGRPSRDGTAFLSASIADAAGGALSVTAIEQSTRAHRFTRLFQLGTAIHGLLLLDSDRSGVIYVGALVIPAAPAEPSIAVLCLDPLDGRPLGRVALPANTDADETFRELTVTDDGAIVFLHRTEAGAELRRAACP